MILIIILSIIYYLIGMLVTVAILANEVTITYTTISDYIYTILLSVVWPIVVLIYISSIIIHFLYLWLR
jgi:hypothetical protein